MRGRGRTVGTADVADMAEPISTHETTTFDAELPWGCWLRMVATADGHVYVDDAAGRTFPSLRSAFWNGRMGMPWRDQEPPAGMLDVLRAALAGIASGRRDDGGEAAEPLGDGATTARWLTLWLASAGLVELDQRDQRAKTLTGEGRSALRMLDATTPTPGGHRPTERDNDPTPATVFAEPRLPRTVPVGIGAERDGRSPTEGAEGNGGASGRVMAQELMSEALALLDRVGERIAAARLQHAIDSLSPLGPEAASDD